MLTVAELESKFRVYLDEMDECERGGCHWALIHLLLGRFPDP